MTELTRTSFRAFTSLEVIPLIEREKDEIKKRMSNLSKMSIADATLKALEEYNDTVEVLTEVIQDAAKTIKETGPDIKALGKIKLKDADAQAAIQEQKDRLEQRLKASQRSMTIATAALNETKMLTGQEWKDSKLAKLQGGIDERDVQIRKIQDVHAPKPAYVPEMIIQKRTFPRLTI